MVDGLRDSGSYHILGGAEKSSVSTKFRTLDSTDQLVAGHIYRKRIECPAGEEVDTALTRSGAHRDCYPGNEICGMGLPVSTSAVNSLCLE